MLGYALRIENLSELQQHIYETLCDYEQLERGVFEMTQRILVRGGRPCGIYFCLHGPRSVKSTAIWETDANTILYYSSTGERFQKTHLISAPPLSDHLILRGEAPTLGARGTKAA
jgi:hypothetical protein